MKTPTRFCTVQPKAEGKKLKEREMSRSESLTGERDPEESRYTWYCQDGAGGIWSADLSFSLNALPPKRLLHYHAGAIVACVVSPVTYLVLTLGEDGTLRLYDFLKKSMLAVTQFKVRGFFFPSFFPPPPPFFFLPFFWGGGGGVFFFFFFFF